MFKTKRKINFGTENKAVYAISHLLHRRKWKTISRIVSEHYLAGQSIHALDFTVDCPYLLKNKAEVVFVGVMTTTGQPVIKTTQFMYMTTAERR